MRRGSDPGELVSESCQRAQPAGGSAAAADRGGPGVCGGDGQDGDEAAQAVRLCHPPRPSRGADSADSQRFGPDEGLSSEKNRACGSACPQRANVPDLTTMESLEQYLLAAAAAANGPDRTKAGRKMKSMVEARAGRTTFVECLAGGSCVWRVGGIVQGRALWPPVCFFWILGPPPVVVPKPFLSEFQHVL